MTQLTLTQIVCPECPAPARRPRSLMAWLKLFVHRRKTRRELASLPDYLIRDLGLTPHEVRREIVKPFWR